ncbi:hemerythrin domain-containing protein [Sphingomonas sp. 37zxx]|uniref:hemerythrin domain-containing protein n=1 Tax=Sphingomonas sp. 37zxx TaxID=1550073 RepID=UPI0006897821|nr:hemerythrin domain-containing protein [Sphingomonas sp. 37zxx]
MYSFERLIREHKAIGVLAGELMRAAQGAADAEGGRRALSALATELCDHLANEDADIYPLLILSKDEGAAAMARDAIAVHQSLAADFTAYAAHWTQDAIAADWERFADATDGLMQRLGNRIRTENELLYPLALRAAHISLRG